MSDLKRTVLAIIGMIIILLSLLLIFRLDNQRHEKEMQQWRSEQSAINEGFAAEAKGGE